MSKTTACSHLASCPMFALFTQNTTTRIWKDNYCEGDFKKCARYQRSQEGKPVPNTLMPNGKELQLPKR
ncbi:MAG: hypothetical protein U0487_02600 [Patescibacteria group bacterium]